MIERKNGEANILPFKKKASEAFVFNDVVTTDASGFLTKATATTPRLKLLGLIQRTVASTDLDYAQNTLVEVDVFSDKDDVYVATVDTGTLVQAMVNSVYDLADENGINVSVSSQKAVRITKVISTTKAEVKFNRGGGAPRIESIQQTVGVASFTDGGSTVGTYDLLAVVPAGAVVVQSFITDVVGFAGDTSAVLTIGDGTDVDRYNTGTPDVFTTASDISAGVPSGTAYHSAVKTPKLTITSATDFTLVKTNGAGLVTVTIFYYVAR